ncbi:MAG TPA: HD domain-containing phosphohydrolase, partial [Candidatus Polarisedimenticolia bacterium]|nr:HD domain-containing phosphohydrolase [Candidatus Polarisedimenticolia bacterium]
MTSPGPVALPLVLGTFLLASVFLLAALVRRRGQERLEAERTGRDLAAMREMQQATLEAVTLAIDSRDPGSRGHVRKVQRFALALAHGMERPGTERQALRVAALLHDVGKVVVPDHLLCKPGRLSQVEFERVKAHPTASVAILAPAGLPEPVLEMIRHHHERWDGTGYPDGLRGESIPMGARILAVADAFEALTADRSYRARMTPADAAALIDAWSGIQFDPAVVVALRMNLDDVMRAGESESIDRALLPAATAAGGASGASEDLGGFGDALHQSIEAPIAKPAESAPRTPLAAGTVRDTYAAQREVYALYEIARTFGSSLRLNEVLDLVVSRIAQLIPFRTCVVYLSTPGSADLVARFASGANAAAMRGRRVRVGEGITGWAAAHRSSRFSGNPELEVGGAGLDASAYGTVAAFPLCHGDEVLGVITLCYPKAGGCSDDDVRVMEIIARLAAGAVHDGRLASVSAGTETLTDPLTHLPTERFLKQVFEQETLRSQQSGQPLAVVAMDLDDFGALNARIGQ